MKNKFIIFLLIVQIQSTLSFAENLNITAKKILIDKKTKISIFENEVIIKDEKNNIIKSDYAEYNRKKGFIKFKFTLTPNPLTSLSHSI